jgi:1-acyl-sn-glycerol-3-phosphate acyltransferase
LPAIREVEKAAGLIPVNKNPGVLNREFIQLTEQTVKNGDSMLIFPEGYWYPDFSPDHPLDSGAAFLAQKFALHIIPVYIHGANAWRNGQEVYISFSQPFEPAGEGKQSRQQTTEMIRSAIAELQTQYQNA